MFQLATLLIGVTLVSLLCYPCYTAAIKYDNIITIDPKKGKDTVSCINGGEACLTLSWAFNSTHRKSSTMYILERGIHYLSSATDTFNESLSSLVFIGSPRNSSQVVIHCIEENTGLAFEGVKDIKFMYLTFYNCSALRNSTSRDYSNRTSHTHSPVQFQVGLYFYLCANVIMAYVSVSDSPNATGVVMYDTNGINRISDSVFQNNIISPNTTHGGGGGFYVEFTYCKPGDTYCSDYHSYGEVIAGAQYYFTQCQFLNNRAHDSTLDKGTYLVDFQSNHVAFGRGGGLSIFIKGESHSNIFEVRNCHFIGNSATWGGGMLAEFQDYALNNSLYVTQTTFISNKCQYSIDSGTNGGGLRIGHCVYMYNQTTLIERPGNEISIESCDFYNNKGFNGGGLSLVVPRQNTTNSKTLAKISIAYSIFSGNVARLGSAFHIDGFALILFGQVAEVHITSCEFENNTVQYTGPQSLLNSIPYQDGLGAMYIHGVNVAFHGGVTFSKNEGSGLAAVSTQLSFCDCSAVFSDNSGTNGGGIALLGGAHLMINENTHMQFIENHAKLFGGGIYNTYISRENSQSYTHCFIRHMDPFKRPSNWGAKFEFRGNMHLGGSRPNSIHTTSILPCFWADGVGINPNKTAVFCWDGWSYTNGTESPINCASQLSTDAGNMNFTTPSGKSEITAFPGYPFNLQINITDDLSHDAREDTEFIAVINTSGSTLGHNGDTYSHIWKEEATVLGKEGEEIVLTLHTNDQRSWYLEMVVKLLPCPPGFKQKASNTTQENQNQTSPLPCTCANGYAGAVECFQQHLHAWLKNNNWMGSVGNESYHHEYLTAPCPPRYCHYNEDHLFFPLPNNSVSLESVICGSNNRQGVLCGKCADGYETAVNSPNYECVNCTNVNIASNIFKYIAITYIPIVVIFFVIMLFGIRLTSAPANCFIIYSQIISSTFNLNADGQIPLNLTTTDYNALLNAYRLPYGIFNLELLGNVITPFCIGTGHFDSDNIGLHCCTCPLANDTVCHSNCQDSK